MEYIEDLKSFFDEIGVVFCEGPATLNWPAVLTEIRNNFEDWLEDGGWSFLNDEGSEDGDREEGEDSEDDDPSADYGSEEEDDDESSFGSGEDDESFSDEDESAGSEDLSEEGLSWDELDKMAEEEDRKANTKRTVAPTKHSSSKRPQGRGKSGR